MKAHALKRDLNEIKSSMNEINNIALSQNPMNTLQEKIRKSFENLVDDPECEGIVSYPDEMQPENMQLELPSPTSIVPSDLTNGQCATANGIINSADTVKFEQKRTTSASKTKIQTNGFSSEQATANSAEVKKLQAGDLEYKEANAAAAMSKTVEADGIKAEEKAAMLQEARSLKTSEFQAKDSSNLAATSTKLQSDTFSQEKTAMSQQQQRQMVTSSGSYNKKEHLAQTSHVRTVHNTITTTSQMSTSSSQSVNGNIFDDDFINSFEDLERLCTSSNSKDIETAISKYTNHLSGHIRNLTRNDSYKKSTKSTRSNK
jgi:hypothetical protein